MSEKKHYKIDAFEFEFTPEGSPLVGVLKVSTEGQTFSSSIKLAQLGSRAHWAKEAEELYPGIFSAASLKRALNELSIKREEEVEAAAAAASTGEEDDARGQDPQLDEKAEELISEPGVLDRYVKDMADVHEVHEDRPQMKVVMLGGSSAQLDVLPTNKPLGTNVILTGEPGRGKNYITDAVAGGLPDEWVYGFESASAKSFYYETEQDPERFESTFGSTRTRRRPRTSWSRYYARCSRAGRPSTRR